MRRCRLPDGFRCYRYAEARVGLGSITPCEYCEYMSAILRPSVAQRRVIVQRLFRIVDVHLGQYSAYRSLVSTGATLIAPDEARDMETLRHVFDAIPAPERDRVLNFLRTGAKEDAEGYLLGAVADRFLNSEPWGHVLVCRMEEMYSHPPRAQALWNAVVTSGVSNLESLLRALLKGYYHLSPEALLARSRENGVGVPELSLDDINRLQSLEGLVQEVMDRRIERDLAGGLEAQAKFLDKRLSIDLKSCAMSWKTVLEIEQRRHLVVHTGGLVTRKYLDVTGARQQAEGDPLPITEQYIGEALEELYVVSLVLAYQLLKKFPIPNRGARSRLATATLEALKERRWATARFLAQIKISETREHEAVAADRVNLWLAQIEGGTKRQEYRDEMQAWDVSLLDGDYRLAKLVLLDDRDEAIALLRQLLASGQMTTAQVSDWPLFDEMRGDSHLVQLLDGEQTPTDKGGEEVSSGELSSWMHAIRAGSGPSWLGDL